MAARKKEILFCALAILLTLVSLSPLFLRLFQQEYTFAHQYGGFFKVLFAAIPVVVVLLCRRIDIDCSPQQRTALFIFLVALSASLVYIHFIYVDTAANTFVYHSNLEWQMETHYSVLRLDPKSIPNTFRFLPNTMVRIVEFCTGDFIYARTLYWLTTMFMLLFSIYYYARIHYGHEKALLAVLLYACIFPVSIRFYAGQLTDPLSHLTFVLSFIFLELNLFFAFVTALAIGVMAKESIVVMAVYYFLFRRKDEHWFRNSVFACLVCAAIVLSIRFFIVPGAKTPLNDFFVIGNMDKWKFYFSANFGHYRLWTWQMLFTVGVFVPFLILEWKSAARSVRNLAVFLLFVLVLSNMTFGWLKETRNLIPAVIPMALIASNYLLGRAGSGSGSTTGKGFDDESGDKA